jgi:5-(carboxyamino)imidazole ribonucleotide synthase
VLKTQQLGYDGQGQCVLRNPEEIESAWCALKGRALIMEEFVPFERELSILVLRGRDGKIAYYPLIDNDHQDGILRRSLAPAPRLKADLQAQAEHYARRIAEELHYVGVLAVEFFELDGQLLANEMAPRVHNSGHWTIEGAETSQFENHLRAIAGLPLGSTHSRGYSAMVNLIGTLPDTEKILAVPGARLHLYGKAPRPGRKLGHVTVCASTSKILQSRLAKIQSIISRDNERI